MVKRIKYIVIPILAIATICSWGVFDNQNEKERNTDYVQVSHVSDERELVIPRFTKKNTPEQILKRYAYTTSYNQNTLTPNWVGWILTDEHTDGEYARKGHSFMEDLDVPFPRARYTDIREGECGYQRGHMCPAGDNKWSYKAQREAFLMTNICPQNGYLNQHDWKYQEEACREWAKTYGKIFIIAGPVFDSNKYKTVGEHKVAVPDAFFKVIMVLGNERTAKAIGFIYPNKSGHHEMEYYACSVDEIEAITGLDFFYQLEDDMENRIEANFDYKTWRKKHERFTNTDRTSNKWQWRHCKFISIFNVVDYCCQHYPTDACEM